jgi:hypothetical protein
MKTKKSWIQGLIITSTCCLVGAAAAIHLYPRITMSNDEAQARQDMQQILAAVREYRAENNGKFPSMEDLPADVPRRAPLSFSTGNNAAYRAGLGPRYYLVVNHDTLRRLEAYNERVPFDPKSEPILYIGSNANAPSKMITREYISSPGKYFTQTRRAQYVLAGFLDGRVEKVWTPTMFRDTLRVLNTWGIGDEK